MAKPLTRNQRHRQFDRYYTRPTGSDESSVPSGINGIQVVLTRNAVIESPEAVFGAPLHQDMAQKAQAASENAGNLSNVAEHSGGYRNHGSAQQAHLLAARAHGEYAGAAESKGMIPEANMARMKYHQHVSKAKEHKTKAQGIGERISPAAYHVHPNL